jgi:hypothetical protein
MGCMVEFELGDAWAARLSLRWKMLRLQGLSWEMHGLKG